MLSSLRFAAHRSPVVPRGMLKYPAVVAATAAAPRARRSFGAVAGGEGGFGGEFAKRQPMLFGMAFSGIKCTVAALFSEVLLKEKKIENIDWKHVSVFTAFGVGYCGGIQYLFYVHVLGRMFPNGAAFAAKSLREKMVDFKGQLGVLGQTATETFIHTPLGYLPAYYLTNEYICGSEEARGGKNFAVFALEKYAKNFKNDMWADMSIWVPSHLINFTIMPMHLRIPWVASTSFFYSIVLAYMRGGSGHSEPHPVAEALALNIPLITDDQLIPVIQHTIRKHMDPKTRLLPNEAILDAFHELGWDESTAGVVGSREAFLELFHWGRADTVTDMEFAAVMLAVTGPTRSVEQRFEALYRALRFDDDDGDGDGHALTRDEVRNLIYSLISIRETLTMGNTWTSSYDFNFTYAYDSKGVETASTVERKKNRVAKLIEDYPEYKGLTTLEEILKADAKRLATAFFEEANIKGKALSKQELIAWAKKQGEHPSKTAKEIMQLNTTFAKAALKKETWPSYYTTSVI
jgi:hypothetical protein